MADNNVSVSSQTSTSLQIDLGGLPNLGTIITSQVLAFVNSVLQGITVPVPAPPPLPAPTPPSSLTSLLLSLVNRQVQIATSFETLTGTLIAVRADYAALVESDGSLTFVRISQIDSVVEL